MKISRLSTLLAWGILPLSLLLGACAEAPKPASLFKPSASLQEIMHSIIDPNADEVWNSVATVVTAQGTEERSPHTDEEWQKVRRHAITLAEAANLLLIDGRPVAALGVNTSSHPVELSPAEIQKTIDAHNQQFKAYALALHDATTEAIAAIDAKNTEELVRIGGKIDQVCESCHTVFWYPNDKKPSFPALGDKK